MHGRRVGIGSVFAIKDEPTRLSTTTAIAFVAHPKNEPPLATELARVEALFAGSFEKVRVSAHRLSESLSAVVVHEDSDGPGEPSSTVVWGACVGQAGRIAESEIARVRNDPLNARELLGRYFILFVDEGEAHAVVTAEIAHVLKIVRGVDRTVVATSGVLAASLSRRSLAINHERIAEFVALDCVLGNDELLCGVEIVDEASVVRLRGSAVSIKSYWPLSERIEREKPPEPRDLWEHLTDIADRVFADSAHWLGLTAGRDSTLVAATASASGRSPTCFTFGDPEYWEVKGAKALCTAAGWEHHDIWRVRQPWLSVRSAASRSAWTDGLESGRNLYGAPWAPRFHDVVYVSGHGGEVGRAFYWKNAIQPATRMTEFATGAASTAPPAWAAIAKDRILDEISRYDDGDAARALDVFYARNRTRNWTGRAIRRTHFSGSIMAYGSPQTVRLLLDIPEPQRRDGSFFDEVISLDPKRLRAVAVTAATRAWNDRMMAARGQRKWLATRDVSDPVRLAAVNGPSSLVREVFGFRWYQHLARQASFTANTEARRRLWNVIAVDALHRAIT